MEKLYSGVLVVATEQSFQDRDRGKRYTYCPESLFVKAFGMLPEKIPVDYVYLNELSLSNLTNKVILVIGEQCLNAVTSKKGIVKERGKIIPTAIGSVVIPTLSPVYAQYNEEGMDYIISDIELAYKKYLGIEEYQDVTKEYWIGKDTNLVEDITNLISYCRTTGTCCFDFETNAKAYYRGDFRATMLSISFQPGGSYILPLYYGGNYLSYEDIDLAIDMLKELFLDESVKKVGHNIKFDLHVARTLGIEVKGLVHDTMLMHHLIDPSLKHDLKTITSRYYPRKANYEDKLDGKGGKNTSSYWESHSLPVLGTYAATDTDATLRLFLEFESTIIDTPRLYDIYRNQVTPMIRILFEAESRGLYIDKEYLYKSKETVKGYILDVRKQLVENFPQSRRYKERRTFEVRQKAIDKVMEKAQGLDMNLKRNIKQLARYKTLIHEIRLGAHPKFSDITINFNSPDQVNGLLYSEQGFNMRLVTDDKTGLPISSTESKIIKRLDDKTGFIELLLVYRALVTIYTRYLVAFERLMDASGCIHPEFGQHGTRTGRLACKKPNVQNITTRSKREHPYCTDATKMVKRCFVIPSDDYLIQQQDFSQMELRIAAEFAKEARMIEVFRSNGDMHTQTAMLASKRTKEEWDTLDKNKQKDERFKAKAGNFGLIYRMSIEGFIAYARDNYGISYTYAQAEDFVRAWFAAYPAITPWHNMSVAYAQMYGYSLTLLGRRRYYRKIHSIVSKARSKDERDSINTPVQGTSGELTQFAMVLLYYRMPANSFYMFNTVHDSIMSYIIERYKEYIKQVSIDTCRNLPTQMYFGNSLKLVTLETDIEVGLNWKDLEPA